MSFPESTSRLNDHNYPFTQSLAFHTLFTCGKIGDVNNYDRVSEVALTESNRYLLKHCAHDDTKNECVRPFAQRNPWIYWAQNTSERHGANGQKNFCLKNNSGDNNLTEEKLKTIINNGGEDLQKILGRMQTFNANISGINAYFVKRRK